MDSPIIDNFNVTIIATPSGGETTVGEFDFLSHNLGPYFGNEQEIGSSPELVWMNEIDDPEFIFIQNAGNNTVRIDSTSTFDAFPQKIFPGNKIFIIPETSIIYAVTDTGTTRILIISTQVK